MIVDRSDVVLALWDGQAARGRGGTAEIVSYAEQQGVPVLRVGIEHSKPSMASSLPVLDADLPGTLGPLSDKAFEQLDLFNSSSVDPRTHDPKHLVMPGGLDIDVPPQVQQLVAYAQPYFHRAEQTARASQRMYLRLARLLYSLAGAAVVLVATQIIFLSKYPRLVWAEVVALVAVIITLAVGRLARPHDRWIAARYLAERIRSSVFLAAVGAGDTSQAPPETARPAHSAATDPNREWADRALREISCRTPTPPVLAAELPVLRTMLIRAWIDDQIGYHKGAAARLTRRQRQLTWLAAGLFGVSALAALFHSMNILVEPSEPDVWGYMSIIIPAIGAALSGYGAQREYARLAERSRVMVLRLLEARRLVAEAKDLPALQQTARGTALLMQAETLTGMTWSGCTISRSRPDTSAGAVAVRSAVYPLQPQSHPATPGGGTGGGLVGGRRCPHLDLRADPDPPRLVEMAAVRLAQAPPGHPHGRPAHSLSRRTAVRSGMTPTTHAAFMERTCGWCEDALVCNGTWRVG